MTVRNTLRYSAVFGAAVALRSVTFPNVVTPVGVQFPYAGDLYYHMRRIWYSVFNFPEALPFDLYVSYPNGSEIVWPSTFDWTIAALARLLVGPDQGRVELLVIWLPPLLAAATAVLVAVLTARLYATQAGWWAGGLFAALPMSFAYSQLGNVDHHVGVAFATTAMLGLALRVLRRGDDASLVSAAGLGLAMAAVLMLWPGALLHVGVLQAVLGVWWLLSPQRSSALRRGACLAVSQAFCAAAIAPFALGNVWSQYGAWSPLVLSDFQPAYFATVAVGAGLATLLLAGTSLGASRLRRGGTLVGLAAAVALLLGALPPLRDSLHYAVGWFGWGEEFQKDIYELRPLFLPRHGFDPSEALRDFGIPVLLFPLAWGSLAWGAWRRRSAPHAALLAWALAFAALTLLQRRFGNSFAVPYSIVSGAALVQALSALRRHPSKASRLAGAACLIGLVGVTVFGFARIYVPHVQRARAALRDESIRNRGPLPFGRNLSDLAGRWMAEHTPETSGYLDARAHPEYGVLCPWAQGHILRYRAERPMVQDNFGVYGGRETFDAAREYHTAEDEARAVEILDRLGVRYVVAQPSKVPGISSPTARSMKHALTGLYGSEGRIANTILPALAHHRLVFHADTRQQSGRGKWVWAPPPHTHIGVWERVAGARVEGRAAPGARIEASLWIVTSAGRRHRYATSARADAAGRYLLVLPYSTDAPVSSAVRVAKRYRISSKGQITGLSVPESAVVEGLVVVGPTF